MGLSLVKTSSANQHPIFCVRVRQHHSTKNPRIRAADEVLTRDTRRISSCHHSSIGVPAGRWPTAAASVRGKFF
jgi:hypothetical protein